MIRFHYVSADHSLFINCGGPKTEGEGNEYESDLSGRGTSNYVASNNGKWAYSSTGVYLGKSDADYVATNEFSLNISGPQYYQTARLAPLSLNYYGLCMLKGNYKVKLHFAEIMFSDDQTFSSLGRRIFDVSIQVSNEAKYLLHFFICFLYFIQILYLVFQEDKSSEGRYFEY